MVPGIRIGNVDGLERCPEYGLGCGQDRIYNKTISDSTIRYVNVQII
jgi:hypothetical protein